MGFLGGGWSEAGYHCITVGRATSSVRSLSIVGDHLWAAYRNCIIVIDPKDLTVKVIFIVTAEFRNFFFKLVRLLESITFVCFFIGTSVVESFCCTSKAR